MAFASDHAASQDLEITKHSWRRSDLHARTVADVHSFESWRFHLRMSRLGHRKSDDTRGERSTESFQNLYRTQNIMLRDFPSSPGIHHVILAGDTVMKPHEESFTRKAFKSCFCARCTPL